MRVARTVYSILSAVLLQSAAQAATVTSTNDSGPGSLRRAIATAPAGDTIGFSVTGTIALTSGELLINKDLKIEGPGADKLTIMRSPAIGTRSFRIFHLTFGTVSLAGLTIANGQTNFGGGILNETELKLNSCTITGNSATVSGGGLQNAGTLSMSNCVIVANAASASGGGIDNHGNVSVVGCRIVRNSVISGPRGSAYGGGINNAEILFGGFFEFKEANLFLTNSVVANNSANGGAAANCSGGGISNRGAYTNATMVVDTSTIDGNTATGGSGEMTGPAHGGGIANDGSNAMAIVVRSTISSNSVIGGNSGTGFGGVGDGGGVAHFWGTMLIENSTISDNSAASGVGPGGTSHPAGAGIITVFANILISQSTVTANLGIGLNSASTCILKNSIVAGNFGRWDLENDIPSNTQSAGFNLFGSIVGDMLFLPSDRTDLTAADLRLGSLQDNGGPTLTHALLCGSPAINAGDNSDAPATDQRGFPRIVDGVIDIGAFELSNAPPTITCSAPQTLLCAPPTGKLASLSATVADRDGDMLVVIWTVNGVPVQTNLVEAGISTAPEEISFMAQFGLGTNVVTVSVSDPGDCVVTCASAVTVLATGGPTISCPESRTLSCAPPTGSTATVSLTISDAGGQPTVVVWTLNGSPVQTNLIVSGGLEELTFTSNFPIGTNQIVITASNAIGCVSTCSTSIAVLALGDVYPIALSIESLAGVPLGGVLTGFGAGSAPGNFGWLTWSGSPSEATLVKSLIPPGNSSTYVNHGESGDHVISVGDWVNGKPGLSISDGVRLALDTLKLSDITLPVWDRTIGGGNTSFYRVAGFARVRLLSHDLPRQNRITARLLGFSDCR